MICFKRCRRGLILLTVGVLILAMLMGAVGCSLQAPKIQAADLMKGITAKEVEGKELDELFLQKVPEFYFELLKRTVDEKENSLVSPLSVMLALAMTANGARHETLAQMETVLGHGITLEDLNRYLLTYTKSLPAGEKSRLSIANSIWFRDDEDRLVVPEEFLQKNAEYYSAQIYKSPFDGQTLKDINNWVEQKTEGMIDKILDEISYDAVMYLINAIVFDAEWERIYRTHEVNRGRFVGEDGQTYDVDFMTSEESIYLEDETSTGFIKPYAGGHYSFVALLPGEGIPVKSYIDSLSGERFRTLIQSATREGVSAVLPKFSYDYEISMNDALSAMGMPDAFNSNTADFKDLGRSSRGNIYIAEVLHKTFIAVDERGTRAGAVTKVEMQDEAAMEMKVVRLDRPFVYAIIDNATSLPIFIGTVMGF